MTLIVVLLGLLAGAISMSMIAPVSRELIIKMGTLVDVTERANPELFRGVVAPINPFVDGRFQHKRLTAMLKADLSGFGEISQRLQREAKKLDRRAHVGMLPFGLYVLGVGLWFAL